MSNFIQLFTIIQCSQNGFNLCCPIFPHRYYSVLKMVLICVVRSFLTGVNIGSRARLGKPCTIRLQSQSQQTCLFKAEGLWSKMHVFSNLLVGLNVKVKYCLRNKIFTKFTLQPWPENGSAWCCRSARSVCLVLLLRVAHAEDGGAVGKGFCHPGQDHGNVGSWVPWI